MGSILPMNDLDVLPLQAADLLAGQLRLSSVQKGEQDPEPLGILRRRTPMWISIVDERSIWSTISYHNFGISTQRLLTIKRQKGNRDKKK